MHWKPKGRRARRGLTFVEVLMSGLILSIGVMGLVGMWSFAFNMTVRTDQMGVAYALSRQALESVKAEYVRNVRANPAHDPASMVRDVTAYYDGNQTAVSQASANKQYSVRTVIAVAQAGNPALCSATVTVRRLQDNQVLYTSNTYLVKAGI